MSDLWNRPDEDRYAEDRREHERAHAYYRIGCEFCIEQRTPKLGDERSASSAP